MVYIELPGDSVYNVAGKFRSHNYAYFGSIKLSINIPGTLPDKGMRISLDTGGEIEFFPDIQTGLVRPSFLGGGSI